MPNANDYSIKASYLLCLCFLVFPSGCKEADAEPRIARVAQVHAERLSHRRVKVRMKAAQQLRSITSNLTPRGATRDLVEEDRPVLEPETIELMVRALDDDRLRRSMIDALGFVGDERTGEKLIQYLADEDPMIRGATAKAVGRMRVSEAIPQLIILLDDTDSIVRRNACTALGYIGDIRAATALVEALEDPIDNVVSSALRSLARIRYEPALTKYVEIMLDEERPRLRVAAIMALASLYQTTSGMELLNRIANDERLNSVQIDGVKNMVKEYDHETLPWWGTGMWP